MVTSKKMTPNTRTLQHLKLVCSGLVILICSIQLVFGSFTWVKYADCRFKSSVDVEDYKNSGEWLPDNEVVNSKLIVMLMLLYMSATTLATTISGQTIYVVMNFIFNMIFTVLGCIVIVTTVIMGPPALELVCADKDIGGFRQDVIITSVVFIVYWTFIIQQMFLFYKLAQQKSCAPITVLPMPPLDLNALLISAQGIPLMGVRNANVRTSEDPIRIPVRYEGVCCDHEDEDNEDAVVESEAV